MRISEEWSRLCSTAGDVPLHVLLPTLPGTASIRVTGSQSAWSL
jgi:hypothetical protein